MGAINLQFKTEADLEEFLYQNQEWFMEKIDIPNHELYRQMQLGPYGVADFVAINNYEMPTESGGKTKHTDISIVELKNASLSHLNISQLARYKRFFYHLAFEIDRQVDIRGVLIGPQTFPNSDDLCYLAQDIEWLEVYEFTLDPASGLNLQWVNGWGPKGDPMPAIEKVINNAIYPDGSLSLKVVN